MQKLVKKVLFALVACQVSVAVTASDIPLPAAHSQLPDGILLGDSDKLDPTRKPGENFDLLDWSLTLPTDINKDKRADTVFEKPLSNGFELKPFFYTAADGGMVFACPNVGAKTSSNTKYARTELREMLRRGKGNVKVQGVTGNNWVFSSVHGAVKKKAGGIDGSLEATLAVNRVSTTGKAYRVGRVIIGQIHAKDDEPIRLYYRKLPGNERGSVYFAHEIMGGDDVWVDMIGSRADSLADPVDGIRLNEKFSYKISVADDLLFVTIIRAGKKNVTATFDMSDSGYDKGSQYMYFKAGIYNQNNGGAAGDYAQATFYHLSNTHQGYRH